MRATAREAACVARAKGVALAHVDEVKHIEIVCRATVENVSSMLQDIRCWVRIEIDFINGAVAKDAQRLGVCSCK